MTAAESKLDYIVRAKESLRADPRAKTWEEKVRSIERMRAAAKSARLGMTLTLASKSASENGRTKAAEESS